MKDLLTLTLLLGTAAGALAEGPPAIFTDEAAATGLDFVHFNGMSGERYFNEIVGSGAALFDYDNDGDLDVYLVQGRMLGLDKSLDQAVFPPRHPLPLTDRLYRNDLMVRADGSRVLRFTDVTEKSGALPDGYGMGVAAGDYDNDGRIDLYVTLHGSNHLLHNDGPGPDGTVTFSDQTRKTGTDERKWSTSAAFLDFDRDGYLDLFVANYVAYSVANHSDCPNVTGESDYCGPLAYPPESDRLLRNRGGASFEDTTASSGIGAEKGSGLGVVTADWNGDGWIDVYVADDLMANRLWLNQGGGVDGRVTFVDEALLGGCSANGAGTLEASMGVVAGDLDGDGDEDLFMAHIGEQTNTFYRNDGQALFEDASLESGLGPPSWKLTGFGTALLDYDNDGRLDVLVVYGAVKELAPLRARRDPFPLHEVNQLYRNLGHGRFEETSATAGEVFALSEVSRGAAVGDVDNDGDSDVLIANNAAPARLLINHAGQDAAWLGLRLVDPRLRRDALGARVELVRPGVPSLWRAVRPDGSYLSSGDPRVLFGLGPHPQPQEEKGARVRVYWPDGLVEDFSGVPADAYTTLERGTGTTAGEGGP